MGCCSKYLFDQVILGQGIPEDAAPECTVFCLVDGYEGGEQVTFWTVGGNDYGAGGLYTNEGVIAPAFSGAFIGQGCLATTSNYTVGGETDTEQTYAFASVADVSVLGESCIAELQKGDLSGTFIAMQCEQVEVNTTFSTGNTATTGIESLTVNGFRHNYTSSFFSNTAAIRAEIQAELENVFGLTVTSVVVQQDGDNVDITIVSNGTVEALTWDGSSTGTAAFF